MSLGNSGRRLRCLLVWSLASAGLVLTVLVAGGPSSTVVGELAAGRLARTPLDVALTDLAALVLLGCATWSWLVTTVVVVEAWGGAGGAADPRGGVPAGVRRVVLAACGVALVGGVTQPSSALTTPSHTVRAARSGRPPAHRGLTGLPLPDRAVASRRVRAGHAPRGRETVVVGAGDTLWGIAVGVLPPHSPDTRVAVRWQAIYAANRVVIGPDPDLIVPGQRLVIPEGAPS